MGAGGLRALQPGDRIVAINDDTVGGWGDIELALLTTVETPVRIAVAGRAEPVLLDIPLARQSERQQAIEALIPAHEPVLGALTPGGVAVDAGLRPGDRILRAAGDTVPSWEKFVPILERHPGRTLTIVFQRDGVVDSLSLTPRAVDAPRQARVDEAVDSAGFAAVGPRKVGRIGSSVHFEIQQFGPLGAVGQGVRRTAQAAGLVLFTVKGLILGQLSPKDIGGPILIGQLSGQAAQLGLRYFLDFLALFSVNLAVLNLLPIPVLDGGHLVFLLIEGVRRKPLSIEARQRFMTVGLVIVLALMVLAIYNDVMRLFQ
jgi:regulator of sigma E protease